MKRRENIAMKKMRFGKSKKHSVIVFVMVFSLCFVPFFGNVAYAENSAPAEEQIEEPAEDQPEEKTEDGSGEEIPESTEAIKEEGPQNSTEGSQGEVIGSMNDANKQEIKSFSEETGRQKQEEKMKTNEGVMDPVPDKTPHLVYGNSELRDEDAFVLLMFGDGFTANEQETFYSESKRIAEYVMDTSPWDEFTDTIKIYALGVISNESGAKGDNAINQEQADADTRDTYFGASFWSGGMQRLVSVDQEGMEKARALSAEYLPSADYNVIVVNSETYGGSGGSICVASLNNESLEMMLHELGHTVADLADEYFAGASYAREYANMTAESDPEKVRWSRFIGKNGVGVYEYDNGGDGWYRPHENCKMRFLGKQYEYCEVCKEELRKAFCSDSNVTKLFFQPYADMFYENDSGKDMKEYFILRRGENEITGDKLGDALQLTYKDSDGQIVEGIPAKAGTYTIEAKFLGNETYSACQQTAEYTIELPDLITLSVESKVYDGQPATVSYDVDYDGSYSVETHYTGTVPYAAEITSVYDSDEAPIKPGRYKLTLTVRDEEGTPISRKAQDFEISFKSTTISNHDTNDYPGAMPYYNNKTIVFTGEGFTADEQEEFETLAKQYIDYFRNTEPYKEADLYFNYHTVEAVSDQSGIGKVPSENTYFRLSYDENGKIVSEDGDYPTQGAMYIGNNVITSYYKATIVIVNDKNVKEGATVTNKRFTVYATPDEAGMEYAASELLNYFTSQPEGYRASTEEEKEAQRLEFLKALYYTWYGTDYAPILSRAYDETFIETGEPIDLSSYFHAYVLDKEIPNIAFQMTYYADDNGQPGKQLKEAPSKAGTYYAQAEFVPEGGAWTQEVTVEGATYNIPLSRGWTTYVIQPEKTEEGSGGPTEGDPGDADDQQNINKPVSDKNIVSDKNNVNRAKTGDSNHLAFYSILFAGSVLVVGTVLLKKRKR